MTDILSTILQPINAALLLALLVAVAALIRALLAKEPERPPPSFPAAEPTDTTVVYEKGNKPLNEDSVLLVKVASKDFAGESCRLLLAIADGVGSTENGEKASKLCIETLGQLVIPTLAEGINIQQTVLEAFSRANRALAVHDVKARVASTLTACAVVGTQLSIAYVGDSRAYLIRGSQATCLTKDHTVDSSPNMLTRWVGQEEDFQVDHNRWNIQKSDVIVICSDGVSKYVREHEISLYLTREGLRRGSRRLAELARSRGSRDDISIVAAVVD